MNLRKKNFFFRIGIGRIFNYYYNSKKKGYFINDVLKKMKLKKKDLSSKVLIQPEIIFI